MAQSVNLAPLLDLSKVTKTYVGQQGCMCGCLGTYAYASHAPAPEDWQGKVNDRTVKSRLNKLVKMVAAGDYDELDIQKTYVYVGRGERCVALYFD